jgi:hypothetical protein
MKRAASAEAALFILLSFALTLMVAWNVSKHAIKFVIARAYERIRKQLSDRGMAQKGTNENDPERRRSWRRIHYFAEHPTRATH